MNLSPSLGAGGVSRLTVLLEDGERVLCRGCRDNGDGEGTTVLAVLAASEHPAPAFVDQLAHEYELKDELDGRSAARPLALVREHERTMLLLEDPGGEPLARVLGQPMEMGRFLRFATGLSAALRNVHEHGLIHKDIKPANVLVDFSTGQVWLTGFGIAARLPRERQSPEPPELVAGTLAYMAPEQTGRMNRSIDSRSDLYSLGVTLYEMLTGALPFTASDPMEWVHCHIARQPVSPAERLKDVPVPVSAIVSKLLAKTAEERYQTAAGLERDLQRCLAAWETQHRINAFPLGQQDTPDRLLIPEKLYGREREIDTLLAAFGRVVTSGRPELLLVSGYSGIGKSAVVNELHRALVPPRGLFASGKFDQYKRDIPYATLAQAFQSLIRSLLGKNDAELAGWRDALREALGPNGRLMIDVVPELKLLIGEQPPVQELPPQQAQGRLQLVFRRFLGVFARPEHPLALFLDDLQWLDAATLDMLADLLTQADVQHLLVIGAYRDNEVDSGHPLTRRLDTIRKEGAFVQEISLAPLAREDLERFVADTLSCAPDRAAPLARLVHEKTAGNPFFAIQFISALAEEGLLRFDHDAERWSWELDRIDGKGYTDNVVDLMVGRLTRLSLQTQAALRQLACLGNVARITTLSVILGKSEEGIRSDLREAVRLELVEHLEGSYKFIHDRVQEAAYSLIPERLRAEAHLHIGRLLAAHTPAEKREEGIFEIVNQLNRGAALITSRDEREQFAELNLLAGRRAKATTAYASALTYLTAGETLLPEDSWERRHELTFALALHRGECEFLTGALTEAERRLAALSSRSANTVERATVACLRADLYTALDQSSRAIAVGLDYLRHLGIDWSPHPTDEEARREYERIWSQLGDRTIESLIELPLMSDPASLATLDVLAKIVPPAFYTDANLLALITCRAVNLSLERGNCDASCSAYEWLCMLAGPHFGDYRTAVYRFGQLGYDLVEGRGLTRFGARTYMDFGGSVLPWTRPVRAGRDLVRRAFEAANKIGDLNYAAYCCNQLNTNLLAAGDPLAEAERAAEHGLAFAQKMRFGLVIDLITPQLGLIRTLRGLTPTFGCFDDEHFDEVRIERRFSANPDLVFGECFYWIRKLQARFFAGDYAPALEAASRAQQLLWSLGSQFETAEYQFYGALSQAASCDSAAAGERQQHLEAVAAHHKQLQLWAANCPDNFENRAGLVGAEIARIEGRELDAERLYEQAIRSARANGFIHNEALANELASRFYASRGFEKIARVYLQDARYGYLRWGADGKVRQLDRLHPGLAALEAHGPTANIGSSVQQLDVVTVVKASQAVSSEIVLSRLIERLMTIALENAGADRGLLILPVEDDHLIQAEAKASGDQIEVVLCQKLITGVTCPESIVHYVIRTRESVILDDASKPNIFFGDDYLRSRPAKSILCLPLIKQGRLTALLYLENSLSSHAFSPNRIAILELLAAQAAISLENTRLYSDLQEREAKVRRLVESNIIGISMFDFDGRVIEANEAFLHIVGHSRNDIVSGRVSWSELTPAEWQEADDRAVAELRATGSCKAYEKEYLRHDGSRVPVLVGAAAIDGPGNQGVCFVLDLTERKRAEEGLRESEAKLRDYAETASDWFWEIDPDYKFTLLTENAFGSDPADRIGAACWDHALDLEAEPEKWRLIQATLDSRKPFRDFVYCSARGDGSPMYVKASGKPVFDASGEFRGYRGTGADVTALRTVEAKARENEQRYRETQLELAHANRVATMGQLTSSIAHEVNQPIAAAVTYASAARRFLSAKPPNFHEVDDALSCIVKEGNRAGEVVGRVRALIKKAPARKDPVAINDAILEVVALTRTEVANNSVSVRTELAEGLPHIRGDRVQLQQVLLNLIINAIEAMRDVGEEERELRISTRNEPDGVSVEVRDSGPGFAPAALERVFEAFYTTKPGGLGLGLSICRSIIEAHNGQLLANANLPRGATFQFALPAITTTSS
jgi:PAS domain S-box-containing protein